MAKNKSTDDRYKRYPKSKGEEKNPPNPPSLGNPVGGWMNDRANDIGNILERAWSMGTMGGILNPYSNFDFGRGKGDYDYGQTTELFRGVREGRPFDNGSTGYPFNQQSAANYGNPPYSPPQTPPQYPPADGPFGIDWNKMGAMAQQAQQLVNNPFGVAAQGIYDWSVKNDPAFQDWLSQYVDLGKAGGALNQAGATAQQAVTNPIGLANGRVSQQDAASGLGGALNQLGTAAGQAINDPIGFAGSQTAKAGGFLNQLGATAQQAITNPIGLANGWWNQSGAATAQNAPPLPQNAPSLPQGQQTTSALPFNIGASSQPVTPPAQNAGVQPAQSPANMTPANTTNVPFNQQNTDTSYGGQQDMYSGGQISFNPNNPATQNTKNPPTGGTPGTSGGKSVKGDPYSDWKPRLEQRGLNWDVLVDVYLNPNRRGTWGRYGNPDAEIQEAAQNYQDDKLWGDTFYEFYGRGPNAQEWTEHYESRTTYIDGYNYILHDPLFTGNPMAEQSYNQKVANLKEMERKEDNKWYYDNPPQNRW